jgi:hypothetical protein
MPLFGVKPLTIHIDKLTLPIYSKHILHGSIAYLTVDLTSICAPLDASAADLSAHTLTQSKPVHHFTFCHRFFIKGTILLRQHFLESFFLTIQRTRNETRAQFIF